MNLIPYVSLRTYKNIKLLFTLYLSYTEKINRIHTTSCRVGQ